MQIYSIFRYKIGLILHEILLASRRILLNDSNLVDSASPCCSSATQHSPRAASSSYSMECYKRCTGVQKIEIQELGSASLSQHRRSESSAMEDGDQHETYSHLELDDSEKETFGSVLQNLKFDCLPSFVSKVRSSGHGSTNFTTPYSTKKPIACELSRKTYTGSYHAVVLLPFADGRQWALKIPRKGHNESWTEPLAKALVSEAQTMRLIGRETSVPVPEIFAFDSTVDNQLGCPFILMELMPGEPLFYGWYNEKVSDAKRE